MHHPAHADLPAFVARNMFCRTLEGAPSNRPTGRQNMFPATKALNNSNKVIHHPRHEGAKKLKHAHSSPVTQRHLTTQTHPAHHPQQNGTQAPSPPPPPPRPTLLGKSPHNFPLQRAHYFFS